MWIFSTLITDFQFFSSFLESFYNLVRSELLAVGAAILFQNWLTNKELMMLVKINF